MYVSTHLDKVVSREVLLTRTALWRVGSEISSRKGTDLARTGAAPGEWEDQAFNLKELSVARQGARSTAGFIG